MANLQTLERKPIPPPFYRHHAPLGLQGLLMASELRSEVATTMFLPQQSLPFVGAPSYHPPRSPLMPVPGGPYKKPLSPKKSKKPEFLVKLYRMLQCEDPAVICWDNGTCIMMRDCDNLVGGLRGRLIPLSFVIYPAGRIHVHDPKVLGQSILHKYFRHSKYSSFQRQLNYFGFRKTQGKGKMSACTYTNFDLANASLKSLLKIKRKTNTSKQEEDLYDDSKSEEGKTQSGGLDGDDWLTFPCLYFSTARIAARSCY